jgi:sugar lactone lactonase YvrE
VEGGRVRIAVSDLDLPASGMPTVRIGDLPARVVFASRRSVTAIVPAGAPGGRLPVRVDEIPGGTLFLDAATCLANGLHQVDSPVVAPDGTIYATYSGARGQQSSVSIYRIGADGIRDIFVSGITNPTSLALDAHGRLHVSSRFDGTVMRVDAGGTPEVIASDLGVACGLAFDRDGVLFVGDRSGTIFRIGRSGGPMAFASLPPSVAAYHLASNPVDGSLYVTAPTLSSRDVVYRVGRHGEISVAYEGFGRPQGIAMDAQGTLYVAEALSGWSGIYRLRAGETRPECLIAGPALIGIALHPAGGYVVSTADAVYRLE